MWYHNLPEIYPLICAVKVFVVQQGFSIMILFGKMSLKQYLRCKGPSIFRNLREANEHEKDHDCRCCKARGGICVHRIDDLERKEKIS